MNGEGGAIWPPPLRLNKRFCRIIIAALTTVIITAIIIWRDPNGSLATFLPFPYYRIRETSTPDYFSTTSSFSPAVVDHPSSKSIDELCVTFPKHLLKTIQPVLKMGHSENGAKVEAQFQSVSACFEKEDLLIFSDLGETINGRYVIDILADLPASYYIDNPDWTNYVWLKEMKANGTLDSDAAAMKRINGWILDKYKFLPMVERAWKTKPGKAFYIFFETDTLVQTCPSIIFTDFNSYIFWDNMFRFLQTFDPDEAIYMGSPSPGREQEREDRDNIKTFFANGGPGFVLSRGAIKALLHRRVDANEQYIELPLTEKWLPNLRGECCGDSAIGWALWNISIPLQGYWPMFNPHPLHGIPFSDLYWCQPPLTLHKTKPEDMKNLWKWEFGQRELGRPLLYADLWRFHHPGQPSYIDNWDNGSWDGWDAPEDAGIDSPEACESFCLDFKNCVQWSWRNNEKKCIAMRSIRYGEKLVKGNGSQFEAVGIKAGWIVDRVEQFRKDKRCEVAQWVGPSVQRIF